MKKRIGNDIAFTWTVNRKNGELLVPESFEGKECMVRLIDDWGNAAVIDDVTFSTGKVTWLFKGKNQKRCSTFTAVLYENQGEDEMVTVDKVKAVTLVAHSYMEDDEECPCGTVEVESVEIESEISTGGGGTPIDAYTKAQTDALLAEKQDVVEDLDTIRSGADAGATAYQKPQTGIPSTDMSSAVQTSLGKADTALQTETDPTVPAWAKAQNKPTYTAQEVGALPDSTTIPSALSDLTDDATHRTVTDTEKTAWNNKVNRNGPSVIEPLKVMENGGDYWTTVTSDDVVVNQKFDGTSTPISLKSLATTVGNKVDKVSGKGLSTNDYTTAEKNKLAGIATGAEVNVQSDWNETDTTSDAYIANKPTIPDAQVQSDWNQSDNTKKDFIKNKPTIPDVTTKADKVNNATNGNFAALDSNGNLIDSGHKHSDYLTSHQDLSNYVQKSNTQGLLKNDGSIDTNTYLTQHQDISGKEDITPIEAVASGTTAITAQVNKYYEVAGTVSSLTVTLPTPTANTEVTMVVVHLTVGASPTVVVTSVNEVVKFSAAYSVVANKEYELSCLYNGSKWIVSSMEVAV